MRNQYFGASSGLIQAIVGKVMWVVMWARTARRAARLALSAGPARGSLAWWMRLHGGIRRA